MKKNMFVGLFALVLCILLVGCTSKDNNEEITPFTMTCTTLKDNSNGMEKQDVVTYSFDKNQNVTSYTTKTTQVFKDKSTYNTYKSAQQETIKDTTDENISYDLKVDDKNKTLVFTMTVKNLDKNVSTEEEKNAIKASTILSNNEKLSATCVLDGITKDKIK